MTIHNRIKTRREQLNMSQESLASLINTSQKQVSRYERGENIPSAEVIALIAHSLHTSADWLLGLTNYPEPLIMGADDLSDTEIETLRTLRSKTPEQQQRIIEIIRLVS